MSRVGSIFNLCILVVSLAGLALIPSQAASAKKTVSGYVYLDREQTGHRNSGDPGIQGVAVSNQRTVVLTDETGYYHIPLEAEDIIFRSKPDEYDFHLNEYFLPQFYYIHCPEGSPTFDYPGIQPTGELPEAINFGLRNRILEERMQVTVIGDPQPRNRQELDYFRAGILNEVAGFDNDYLFVLGDMMYDDLSLFQTYNQMMASLRTPVINVIGNHDLNLDAPNNQHARETFKSYYGPTHYSFSEAGRHFVVLDNIDYRGRD